jgi:hypothetical protein
MRELGEARPPAAQRSRARGFTSSATRASNEASESSSEADKPDRLHEANRCMHSSLQPRELTLVSSRLLARSRLASCRSCFPISDLELLSLALAPARTSAPAQARAMSSNLKAQMNQPNEGGEKPSSPQQQSQQQQKPSSGGHLPAGHVDVGEIPAHDSLFKKINQGIGPSLGLSMLQQQQLAAYWEDQKACTAGMGGGNSHAGSTASSGPGEWTATASSSAASSSIGLCAGD